MKNIKKDIDSIKIFFKYFKPFKWHIVLVETVMLVSIGTATYLGENSGILI